MEKAKQTYGQLTASEQKNLAVLGGRMAAHQAASEPQLTDDGQYLFRDIVYRNRDVWHLLPAGFIAKIAHQYEGEVYIENLSSKVKANAKSALTLASTLKPRSEDIIRVLVQKDGHVSRACCDKLSEFFASENADAYVVAHRHDRI